MMDSLQTGISGLQQFQQDLEVIGNNIANVNTVGYKSSHMEFQDTLSQTLTGGSNPMQVGTGVQTGAIKSQFTTGSIYDTGVTENLAIDGNGFFVVKDNASGATYATRDGQFKLDVNGYLVDNNNLRVQGYTGPGPYTSTSPIGDVQINTAVAVAALNDTTLPPPTLASFNIDSVGKVNAQLSDGVGGVIAQVVLQDFTDPQSLIKLGNNLYSWSAKAGPLAAPAPAGSGALGRICSGAVESSNVDLATEMTSLITAQRAFEANAKVITTSDEMLQVLLHLKR
jgi:flagellar hook protein FlgE